MYKLPSLVLLVQVLITIVIGIKGCSTRDDPNEQCKDKHAACVFNATLGHNTCQCLDGYFYSNGRCRTEGTPLPPPDYASEWILSTNCIGPTYCNFLHGFNETPAIAQVQIKTHGVVYPALGFRPDENGFINDEPNFVVYIYDDRYINVSTTFEYGGESYISQASSSYIGRYPHSDKYYTWIRARAWKLSSLPDPDFVISGRTMKANTSKCFYGGIHVVRPAILYVSNYTIQMYVNVQCRDWMRAVDSFYEVDHELGEHPGLVVVRAKMIHNGTIFYADGVGSGLNVFYNDTTKTNAYLVYGFNNQSFRVWVDSSIHGAIFDGRKFTRFDWIVSEAEVEILAWKLSTIPPYLTRRISLNTDEYENIVAFPIQFRISEGLTVAFTEVRNATAINNGYRFPTSGYKADRYTWYGSGGCVLGGAAFGYVQIPGFSLILSDTSHVNKWWINIPNDSDQSAGLLCIPRTFGNGTKAERANGGTLVVYSWVDDCGVPTGKHATLDISVSGTEVAAYVKKTCDVGYNSSKPFARCTADYNWYDTDCFIVKCGEYLELENGTPTDNGTSYGSTVTFACNEGFELHGDGVITCLANGTWSGNYTRCVEKPRTTLAEKPPTTLVVKLPTTTSRHTSTGAIVSTSVLEIIAFVLVISIVVIV